MPLITAGEVYQSQLGPVILIFHQYAHYGKGKSMHSLVQLEAFSSKVYDKFIKLGDNQTIRTQNGYAFPLDFNGELPYLPLRPFIDSKWNELLHNS